MLVHHRGGDCEMQGRRSAVIQRLWVKLSFDRRRVIDNVQARATGEKAKIARMLRTWRMMQEFRGIASHDSIHIVHAQLAFIDQEPISWRFIFEERHGS